MADDSFRIGHGRASLRVVVVGGGSAYMPGVAFAIANERERLARATIVLQDIDAEAVELQGRLARGILRARGAADVRVEVRTELAPAVEGADLVLTAFRPGGFPARHLDERIAVDHGVIGQETAGPGGFAMALRSVPIVLRVADEIRTRATAGCVLLNYTNPVQIVGEALARFGPTGVPWIGLCDQTAGERRFLGRLLEADPGSIELDTAGTNHMTFTRAVRVDDVDATDEVWRLLDRIPLEDLATPAERRIVRLFRELRHIPSEYLQYFAFHDEVLAEQRAMGHTRAQEVMAGLPDVLASYRREADRPDPRPSMARASEEHGDFAVEVMAAMRGGTSHRTILNLPNGGQVQGLPRGAVVETPAVVQGRRVLPIEQGRLPVPLTGTVLAVAHHAALTAEAAVTGDRDLAAAALEAHPLVGSRRLAEELLTAYLSAHADHLPRFAA